MMISPVKIKFTRNWNYQSLLKKRLNIFHVLIPCQFKPKRIPLEKIITMKKMVRETDYLTKLRLMSREKSWNPNGVQGWVLALVVSETTQHSYNSKHTSRLIYHQGSSQDFLRWLVTQFLLRDQVLMFIYLLGLPILDSLAQGSGFRLVTSRN